LFYPHDYYPLLSSFLSTFSPLPASQSPASPFSCFFFSSLFFI
jgi:hypothetical protein